MAMNFERHLKKIIAENKAGRPRGLYSVCSANRYVVEAAILQGLEDDHEVLIESTCNQVNQFGGYTGMTPQDFNNFVHKTADRYSFPPDMLILGGDHLGPYPFRNESYDHAMVKTRDMIRAFVQAGCGKIHVDASYRLADDAGTSNTPLEASVIADRCALLCAEAEKAWREWKADEIRTDKPVYVIGTEVPAPGGSEQPEPYENITGISELEETISLTKRAFRKHHIEDAWERVAAVVVEPGVEHGDMSVLEYSREKAKPLSEAIRLYGNLVFEAHTTDYQTVCALRQMVEDGFVILKTGQSQTNAAREAVFMLNLIEEEILKIRKDMKPSLFMDILDWTMIHDPKYWKDYYHAEDSSFQRKYSFFDRQRYYWSAQSVSNSLRLLLSNLRSMDIPLSLLGQFMPEQYRKIRAGVLPIDPEALIRDRIMDHMREYAFAVGNRTVLFDWWL